MTDGIDWGYAQHHYSILDVTDEERWQTEEQWAIEDALKHAASKAIPVSPLMAASYFDGGRFLGAFIREVDNNLHRALDVCTDRVESERNEVSETEQRTLPMGGEADGD